MFEELRQKGYIHDFAQKITNEKLKKAIQDYSLYYFKSEKEIDFNHNQEILDNIKNSTVIIFDQYPNSKSNKEDTHFIICFKKILILIKQFIISLIQQLFTTNDKIRFCFLNNTKNVFDENIKIQYKELTNDDFFQKELFSFISKIRILRSEQLLLTKIHANFIQCLCAYFIKESYNKLNTNRITDFYSNKNIYTYERTINEEDYIELRPIGCGYASNVWLIYHIEDEKLYVIKKFNSSNDDDFIRLRDREVKNYKRKINHPFLSKFYGITKTNHYLVIEYIKGETLVDTDFSDYSKTDIFSICIHIISVFKYFHENHLIYRDLNPRNIMIDSNKTAVLIDFDRMVSDDEINNDKDEDDVNYRTNDFFENEFIAPEVNSGKFTNKCDIYSIGKIFNFLMTKKFSNYFKYIKDKLLINQYYDECPYKRPTVSKIIYSFYSILVNENYILNNIERNMQFELGDCYRKIKKIKESLQCLILSANQNYLQAQCYLGCIFYMRKDIRNAIHYFTLAADQNDLYAQNNLAVIYYQGIYIAQDINKAIYYFTLAANQNNPYAESNLGQIFYLGKYIARNINKSIYYFTLAAKQNNLLSQYNLGIIYYEGKYIKRDINKAIYYFTLAAGQKCSEAQARLGMIYYYAKYIKQDISKAIYYFTLAANQNDSEAQAYLGVIYYDGKYIKRDINKAIHYFTLAANQNNSKAQAYLGVIYYDGKYIKRDINKAIHYFTLTANQNISIFQFTLGRIYYDGEYIERNINKAIHYFKLAANQNNSEAQTKLGIIYSQDRYKKLDINQAIHYIKLAANQNNSEAQNNLGEIYIQNRYKKFDINRAIYYFTLAANQNDPNAQNNLGEIYIQDGYKKFDIKKAIHYFTLAANQNFPRAQFFLGKIYYEGKYIKNDINKSINYFTLAANQNNPHAQNYLGIIYSQGKYITRDINKAIYYFTLAAKQNSPQAQYCLGYIYFNFLKTKNSINQGIFFILESAERGNIGACFFIGFLHQRKVYQERHLKINLLL